MAELKINTGKVIDSAVSIRGVTSNLKSLFGDINKIIESLDDVYNTVNTEEIKSKYYELEGKLDGLTGALEKYSAFLEKTTEIYEEVERKIAEQVTEGAAVAIGVGAIELFDEWK
ncbi:MAG: hypothetical protein IKJ73_03740 [Lachnospiraceae bacterium]|nr:hypothetical protein [Lachnospiraceae bacterium]